ncbi:unnamed protein product, partial [Nesidiocoris tenuis]
TLQEELTGASFHPLDDNLLITHGKGHLTFWTRRKDGYFEKTDIIKPTTYECVSLSFHPFGVALAAGSSEGHLVVLNAENGNIITTVRVCGSPLNCLGYSPGVLACDRIGTLPPQRSQGRHRRRYRRFPHAMGGGGRVIFVHLEDDHTTRR